jgi:predicted GIY-YIG superfamily endonuclease
MSKCIDMPTALYRLYDEGGALLYIGISNDPDRRFEQHAYDKSWWPRVARRDVRWLDDRPAAQAAEVAAIKAEAPECNGTHSPLRRPPGVYEAGDGVIEISMSVARAKLSVTVRDVMDSGRAVAFMEHGRRRAYLISPESYERSKRERRIVERIQSLCPDIYAALLSDPQT